MRLALDEHVGARCGAGGASTTVPPVIRHALIGGPPLSRPGQGAVGVRAAVAVERPPVAHLGEQVHVEVADDQLGVVVVGRTSPTNLPSGSTKYDVP